jgi:hypothetical protein
MTFGSMTFLSALMKPRPSVVRLGSTLRLVRGERLIDLVDD